jgi:hypothetical protein
MEICGGPTWTLNAMTFSLRDAGGLERETLLEARLIR